MNLCKACWDRGRNLIEGECMCSGHVQSFTSFHAWNATRRKDHKAPKEAIKAPEIIHRPKLEFGKRPEAPKKKKR